MQNEEEVVMAEDSDSPKIIMPNELKVTKPKKDFDVHKLLQQSRVSKEELVTGAEAEGAPQKQPAQNLQMSEEQSEQSVPPSDMNAQTETQISS